MQVKSGAYSVDSLPKVHACERGARFVQDLSMDKSRRAALKIFKPSTCGFVNGQIGAGSEIQLSGSRREHAVQLDIKNYTNACLPEGSFEVVGFCRLFSPEWEAVEQKRL